MKKSIIYSISILFIASTIFSSCEAVKNASKTQKGAAIGSTAGALLGAIIGNNVGNKKNSKLGAVLGSVVGGVTGGLIGKKMDQQAREIKDALPAAEVERVGEGIKLTLGENAVRFDTNKSSLTAIAKENLDKLIPVFNSYENTNIVIFGFTDSTGKVDYNLTLSQKRADAVKAYLVTKGIEENRMLTNGFGIENPIATNDTAEGRSKNRRVEFAIAANEEMIKDATNEVGGN